MMVAREGEITGCQAADLFERYIGDCSGSHDFGSEHFRQWLIKTDRGLILLGGLLKALRAQKQEEFVVFWRKFTGLRSSQGADWKDSVAYRKQRNEIFREHFWQELSSGNEDLRAIDRSFHDDLDLTIATYDTLLLGVFKAKAMLEYAPEFLREATAYAGRRKRDRLDNLRKNVRSTYPFFIAAILLLLGGIILNFAAGSPAACFTGTIVAAGLAVLVVAVIKTLTRRAVVRTITARENELAELSRRAENTSDPVAMLNIYKELRNAGNGGHGDEPSGKDGNHV